MARGRDAHQAKKAALAALGKDLSRRARSKCELCGESAPLSPTALYPDEEPEVDWALLLCDRCATLLETGRHDGADGLRFLESAVWSELKPAQVAAIHIVEQLAREDDAPDWPRDTVDGLWVEDDVRALVDRLP
ncbi:MAG: hypothetical protein R3F61_12200 [Myxococcota bacterium]